jgi:signal peptidase I
MRQSALRDICRLLIGVFLAALVIHAWFFLGITIPLTVNGSSMVPTLADSQRMIVDRTAFTFRKPRRWEVVVFRSPEDAKQLCVKRVIGLPRELIAIRNGVIWIDGRKVPNPLETSYDLRYGDRVECKLGLNDYFVVGDNPQISDDSRSWRTGPGVDATHLVGKPLGIR